MSNRKKVFKKFKQKKKHLKNSNRKFVEERKKKRNRNRKEKKKGKERKRKKEKKERKQKCLIRDLVILGEQRRGVVQKRTQLKPSFTKRQS